MFTSILLLKQFSVWYLSSQVALFSTLLQGRRAHFFKREKFVFWVGSIWMKAMTSPHRQLKVRQPWRNGATLQAYDLSSESGKVRKARCPSGVAGLSWPREVAGIHQRSVPLQCVQSTSTVSWSGAWFSRAPGCCRTSSHRHGHHNGQRTVLAQPPFSLCAQGCLPQVQPWFLLSALCSLHPPPPSLSTIVSGPLGPGSAASLSSMGFQTPRQVSQARTAAGG